MDKKVLLQYSDLRKEYIEVKEKISRLEKEIESLEKRLEHRTGNNEKVKDKVYGGYGGTQGFVIEGYPHDDYAHKQSLLMSKRLMLNTRKANLEILEEKIEGDIKDIEEFMANIKDSYIRRIINLRVIDGRHWDDVADKMGGGNTAETVKKMFYRFVDKSCPECPEKM